MKIKWLRSAVRDLVELAQYIAQDNPSAGAKELLAVETAVERLSDNPMQGRPSSLPGLRELVVARTPFLVPYRVTSDQIEVLAVFHGARDWKHLLRQLDEKK